MQNQKRDALRKGAKHAKSGKTGKYFFFALLASWRGIFWILVVALPRGPSWSTSAIWLQNPKIIIASSRLPACARTGQDAK
jgi:hypothetical protein